MGGETFKILFQFYFKDSKINPGKVNNNNFKTGS